MDFNNADDVFVPQNIKEDRSNYTEWKAKIFRVVPENSVLVKQSKITGNIRKSVGIKGLHLSIPLLTKSIYVPTFESIIDYQKSDEYIDKNGERLTVDFAIKLKITDPEKYMKSGRYQLANLNVITESLLKTYIKKKRFSELSEIKLISLDEFDPAVPGPKGGTPERAYEDFEKRYGIGVESVELKTVEENKEMQEARQAKRKKELEKEAQEIELEKEKAKAEMDAKIIDIKAEAEAKKIRKIKEAEYEMASKEYVTYHQALSDQGLSGASAKDGIDTIYAANHGVLYKNANGNTRGTTVDSIREGGIEAGIVLDKIRSQRGMSNSDRLIQEIRNMLQEGRINSKEAADLTRILSSDEETRASLDSLDEDNYQITKDSLLGTTSSKTHRKGK